MNLDRVVVWAANNEVVYGEDRADSVGVTVDGVDMFTTANIPDLDGVVVWAADDEIVDGEDRVDSLGVTVEGVDAFVWVDVPDLDGVVGWAADDEIVDGEDRDDSFSVTIERFSWNNVWHFCFELVLIKIKRIKSNQFFVQLSLIRNVFKFVLFQFFNSIIKHKYLFRATWISREWFQLDNPVSTYTSEQ